MDQWASHLVPGDSGLTGSQRAVSVLTSAAVLVLANVVPLALVLLGQWRPGDVLVAYWLENLVVAGWAVVRIVSAEGQVNLGVAARCGLAGIFCVHYGVFTLTHGVLTAMLTWDAGVSVSVGEWAVVLGAFWVSHGISTGLHWFGRGERLVTSPGRASVEPYVRVGVMHVVVLVCFFLFTDADIGLPTVGGPVETTITALAPALAIVGVKTLLDLGSHIWEHRRNERRRLVATVFA